MDWGLILSLVMLVVMIGLVALLVADDDSNLGEFEMINIHVCRLNPMDTHQMESALGIIKSTSSSEFWMLDLRCLLLDCGGLIATDINTGNIVGLLIYSSYPLGREIQIVGVNPRFQRRGAGKALITHMQEEIMNKSPNIKEITVQVLGSQLLVHLFLKACQFRAVEILDDDKYLFVCRKQEVGQPVKRECVGV